MYNFESILENDEKILWQGKPESGVFFKNWSGAIFGIVLSLIFMVVFYLACKYLPSKKDPGFIFSFFWYSFFSFIIFIVLKNIIYIYFFKSKRVAYHSYCITNLRVIKYDAKKDELTYGYLKNYDYISCDMGQTTKGDLIFHDTSRNKLYDKNNAIEFITGLIKYFKFDKHNAGGMCFENLGNLREVSKIAKEARKKFMKTNNDNEY